MDPAYPKKPLSPVDIEGVCDVLTGAPLAAGDSLHQCHKCTAITRETSLREIKKHYQSRCPSCHAANSYRPVEVTAAERPKAVFLTPAERPKAMFREIAAPRPSGTLPGEKCLRVAAVESFAALSTLLFILGFLLAFTVTRDFFSDIWNKIFNYSITLYILLLMTFSVIFFTGSKAYMEESIEIMQSSTSTKYWKKCLESSSPWVFCASLIMLLIFTFSSWGDLTYFSRVLYFAGSIIFSLIPYIRGGLSSLAYGNLTGFISILISFLIGTVLYVVFQIIQFFHS